MIARDLMTHPVITVPPGTSLAEAIRLMGEHKISGLPVVASGDRMVGMLTEGDLLRRVEIHTDGRPSHWLAALLRPGHEAGSYVKTHGRFVEEVMTDHVISVPTTAPVADLVDLMLRHHVKRLPVVNDGRLLGIVSRADLVRHVGRCLSQAPDMTDDQTIARNIHDAIDRETWAPRAGVTVAVTDGVVRLEGCVNDIRARDGLGVLAENVDGVRRVDNQIVCIEPQLGTVTFDPQDPGSARF